MRANFSLVMPEMMLIGDKVDSRLEQTIVSYISIAAGERGSNEPLSAALLLRAIRPPKSLALLTPVFFLTIGDGDYQYPAWPMTLAKETCDD